MKKLLSVGLFLFMAVWTFAQPATLVTSSAYTNGGFKLMLTNACSVTGITLMNSSTTDQVTATFYDNDSATNTYTNAAYTAALTYSTNLTVTYTNAQGIITTNTQTGVRWTTTVAVDAASNSVCATKYTVVVPVSSTVTASGVWDYAKGVVMNIDTNVTATLYYRRFQ